MTVAKILILLLLVGVFVSMVYFSQTNKKIIIQESNIVRADIENTAYIMEGKLVDFENGSADFTVGETQIVSKIFSQKVVEDINNDGHKDAIVMLTQNDSEADSFYLALALGFQGGFHGSNSVLLGKDIAPQTEEYREGIIIVNYANKSENQDEASAAVSRYFSWEEDSLKEMYFANDLVKLNYPSVASYISSPLTVVGEARGYWFFEGDFPVVLTDWDGRIIAEGIATAKGEWMTEDFVGFEAVLEYDKPDYNNRGSLILQKDNPSGLPANDDALEIPIFFE